LCANSPSRLVTITRGRQPAGADAGQTRILATGCGVCAGRPEAAEGESVRPRRISCSVNKTTKSLPYNHARALWASDFGKCPSCANDLRRLNTSSTCQRIRYHCKISTAVTRRGENVVNTMTYFTYSQVSGWIARPLREAVCLRRRSASLTASLLLRTTQRRPGMRRLSPCTTTGHSPTCPAVRSVAIRRNSGNRGPASVKSGSDTGLSRTKTTPPCAAICSPPLIWLSPRSPIT
jgi:hypothetical protein